MPFGVTFFMLVWIWHSLWFRRYALDDMTTTVLTMVLLFVIMFFIYPLKFFSAFTAEWLRSGAMPLVTTADGRVTPMLTGIEQIRSAMGVYSIGYSAIFALFASIYAHAYRQRNVIGLTEAEMLETRFSMYQQVLYAVVGVIAVFLAFAVRTEFAMFAYFLIPPLHIPLSLRLKRLRKPIAIDSSPMAG